MVWCEDLSSLMAATIFAAFSALLFHIVIVKVQTKKDSVSSVKGHHQLKRRMTSIGRFALKSQTDKNQSIVAFFVCLAVPSGIPELKLSAFESLWRERVMKRHERFRSRVSKEDDRYFEVNDDAPFSNYACETKHPSAYEEDLRFRIESMLTSPLDTTRCLWEAEVSTGPLGASGAISLDMMKQLDQDKYDRETLILCRIHHALADGVSMGVALGDASDEANVLRQNVRDEIDRRKKRAREHSITERLVLIIGKILFLVLGSLKAISLQLWRMTTSSNPFELIMAQSNIPDGCRSIAWKNAASISEVKKVAKTISRSATVNDVFVSCVSAAISKQLEEHYSNDTMLQLQSRDQALRPIRREMPPCVNVVVPVHLYGGVLLPGHSLGNQIGAFVTQIPTNIEPNDLPASKRLARVSSSLSEGKSSPAHLISWSMARFCSEVLPEPITKRAMAKGNAHSVAVISNVRGFPFKVHWHGKPVENLAAFLPLPPGVPIGVVVQSYAGVMSFTVDADKRAVPNADKFAEWMLDEYRRLREEAGL